MRTTVVCLSLSLTFFTASNLARADPLRLNTRSLAAFDIEGDFFRFAGTSFDLDQPGRDEFGIPFFIPKTFGISCDPCRPGEVVRIIVETLGDVALGAGSGLIDDVQFSSLVFSGSLAFRTEPVAFPDSSETAVFLNAPFVFTGSVRAFAGDAVVFSHALRGSGKEFAQFVRNQDNRFSFAEGPIIFQFDSTTDPTPEPSTLLLVGGGALALARRHAKRSRPA